MAKKGKKEVQPIFTDDASIDAATVVFDETPHPVDPRPMLIMTVGDHGEHVSRADEFIEVELLHEHPKNYEFYGDTVPDADMVKSVKERGILQSILVRRAEGGTFQIVSGHRRVAAAKAAGLSVVPYTLKMYNSEAEVEADLLQSNIQRVKSRRELKNEFLAMKQIARQLMKERAKSRRSADGEIKELPLGTNVPGGDREREIISGQLGLSERQVKEKTIVYDDEYMQKQLDKWFKNPCWTQDAESEVYDTWCHIRRRCESEELTDSAGAKQVKELIDETNKQLAGAAGLPGAKTKKSKVVERKPANLLVDAQIVFNMVDTDEMSEKELKDFAFDYVNSLQKFVNKGKYSIERVGANRVEFTVKGRA